jgi:aldehyde dehydrogenase
MTAPRLPRRLLKILWLHAPQREGPVWGFRGSTTPAPQRDAFSQLQEKGIAGRVKVVEIIKAMADSNAAEWGRIELEETKIGRLDHKIEKLKIIKLVPGVEWLHPDGLSGDHGITLEEYTPFGVVGAVTPSTH